MKNLGVWIGIVILLFGATIFWQSLSFDIYSEIGPGPGLFPMILSASLIVLSVFYIISSMRKNRIMAGDVLPKGKSAWKVLRIVLAVVLFIIFAPYTGFSITSMVVLLIVFLGEMKWYSAVSISLVTTTAVFIIFNHLLGVPLPLNSFGW
ncbi:MAG TPA: tripartite tricarboxylate transporter TctB family protein [Bacillus sp. (in: firmicutes)]|nr:tripartite tricarboxylate transporter TctB family protein [Bacillus sp. (in: firmicutes)]